jgi:tRNA pseudouridine38-40 synthase
MTRFAAIIEYDGADYHGWQSQKGVPTVQAQIETALARIAGARITLFAAGRTDAGVHAMGQVAHFDLDWKHPPHKLLKALNSNLPSDMAIKAVMAAPPTFHARRSAKKKIYKYYLFNNSIRSSFLNRYSLRFPYPVSMDKLNDAARLIIGAHDFATFGQPTDGTVSTVREIYQARWERIEPQDMLCFTVIGSGFLRYMVRSLVGSMIQVGAQKVPINGFEEALRSRERSRAGPTAAPQGLFLARVIYDDALLSELGEVRDNEQNHPDIFSMFK